MQSSAPDPHAGTKTPSHATTITLVVAAVCACVLFLVGLITDSFALRLPCKPVPHLVILWCVHAHVPSKDAYVRALMGGIAFCMLGDFLLEFRQTLFLYGVGAFLVGHLFFIAAFLKDTTRLEPLRLVPFVIWCGVVFAILRPTLGGMLAPVAVYVVVICVMLWRAAARVGARGSVSVEDWCTFAGAILFAVGDTLIALDRFHASISGVRYPIILTYWASLVLIALSAKGRSAN
jgi:uncharacterized membrane protein YhhN